VTGWKANGLATGSEPVGRLCMYCIGMLAGRDLAVEVERGRMPKGVRSTIWGVDPLPWVFWFWKMLKREDKPPVVGEVEEVEVVGKRSRVWDGWGLPLL